MQNLLVVFSFIFFNPTQNIYLVISKLQRLNFAIFSKKINLANCRSGGKNVKLSTIRILVVPMEKYVPWKFQFDWI